ncbi:hypothetical protein [Brevundimonas sp.]|uniref:hypothetical protein n=1 Tax=Brevundimonas sp. TaxID=1871086 RepID=UPI0025D0BAE3|nr:hypothetical protein [Brevundimonas sp.]
MRRFLIAAPALLALSLAACEPTDNGDGGGTTPPPPPSLELGGVDLAGDVNLLGTEPFWGVEITGGQIRLAGVDRPEMTAPRTTPVIQGTTGTWTSTTDDGQPLVITVIDTDCSDGMSDRTYPLTARVQIGMETLNGCGASSDFIRNTDERGNPRPSATAEDAASTADGEAAAEGDTPAG